VTVTCGAGHYGFLETESYTQYNFNFHREMWKGWWRAKFPEWAADTGTAKPRQPLTPWLSR
jgi:hypothetical protein